MLKHRVLLSMKGRLMPATNSITCDKLLRLIGTPHCPVIVDVRTDADFADHPGFIPGAVRRPYDFVADWAPGFAGRSVVVHCAHGGGVGAGVAAWLRAIGIAAETLEGGIHAWTGAGLPTIPESSLPPRDGLGRTLWVTRARPKVDRIACPWLIRRFVDRDATFLFVAPSDVAATADRFGATPFDVDGVRWSHRGDLCTFDTMVETFGLAGLLAASLGLSRMFADDHEQLDAGMLLYDAYFRWCRDAVDETHDWVSHRPRLRVEA